MQIRDLEEDVERAELAQARKAKTEERRRKKQEMEEAKKGPAFKMRMPPHDLYYKGSPSQNSRAPTSSALTEVTPPPPLGSR